MVILKAAIRIQLIISVYLVYLVQDCPWYEYDFTPFCENVYLICVYF